jgi:hypothetical protein
MLFSGGYVAVLVVIEFFVVKPKLQVLLFVVEIDELLNFCSMEL